MKKEEKERDLEKLQWDHYPIALKMKVMQEVSDGKAVISISREYHIPPTTIHRWCKKFNAEISILKLLKIMNKETPKTKEELHKENEKLQKALQEAMMKVTALETMIDIAEDQLNIEIRKKSGPRQSNK